jgi:hypothetical protein
MTLSKRLAGVPPVLPSRDGTAAPIPFTWALGMAIVVATKRRWLRAACTISKHQLPIGGAIDRLKTLGGWQLIGKSYDGRWCLEGIVRAASVFAVTAECDAYPPSTKSRWPEPPRHPMHLVTGVSCLWVMGPRSVLDASKDVQSGMFVHCDKSNFQARRAEVPVEVPPGQRQLVGLLGILLLDLSQCRPPALAAELKR